MEIYTKFRFENHLKKILKIEKVQAEYLQSKKTVGKESGKKVERKWKESLSFFKKFLERCIR